MIDNAPRSAPDRRRDTLARLEAGDLDAWIATASAAADGPPRAHVVPLSIVWIDERVVVAVGATSRTARSIVEHGVARVAIGPTRDVIMIETRLDGVVPVPEASVELGDAYAAGADWDPRKAGDGYVYISLRPERLQAWREVNEIRGRTLMRSGAWTT